MSVPQTVAALLTRHVSLTLESIDRMDWNVYVPQLQRPEEVARFVQQQRAATVLSSASLELMTTAFV